MKHYEKKLPTFLICSTKEMNTVFLNNYLTERFNKMRQNYNQKCMKKFLKRKYSHQNSENISAFYKSLNITVDPKLFEIKFHISFAFYLYLYLKSRAIGYFEQSPDDFTISKPIQINFTKVAQEAGIARNTVKAAFKELLQLNIVYDTVIPVFHNKVKECMILNSKYIVGFDENEHKVIYSINKNLEA